MSVAHLKAQCLVFFKLLLLSSSSRLSAAETESEIKLSRSVASDEPPTNPTARHSLNNFRFR